MEDEPVQGSSKVPGRGPSPTRQGPLRGLPRVLALIGGLSAAVVGVVLGGLFLIAGLFEGGDTLVASVTLSISIVVITVGLGLAMAWQALQSVQDRPSRAFRPPKIWPLALLFLLALVMGQLVLSLDLLPAVTFPLFHVLAATLPPLMILALAGRALAGVTRWRDAVLQLALGALVSTPLAFVLEAILIVVLALTAMLGVAVRPGGPELLERLAQLLQTAPPLEDPEAMLPVLLSPAVVIGVAGVVAGAVPLIEEAIKTIGVPLRAYRRPGMSASLLWGMAGGAGFALVEGLLNTTGGLQGWALVILVRVGATLLHCLTGALMGLAWYQGLLRQHWWRAMGLYGGSVAIHSLWNVLSVGITFLAASAAAPEATDAVPVLAGLSLGLILALGATALTLALGLAGLVYYVRRHHPASGSPPVEPLSTPLERNQPVPTLEAAQHGQVPQASESRDGEERGPESADIGGNP